MSNSPVVDHDFIDAMYESLKGFEVELDRNPLLSGPRVLQEKISLARNNLTRIQRMMTEVSHQLHIIRRVLMSIEAEIEVKMSFLLSNDNEVRQCKSVKDREAMANVKMHEEVKQKIKYNSAQFELDSILTVIKVKEKDMKDVLARLRDQIKLCQDEITLGGSWGKDLNAGSSPMSDEADDIINSMFSRDKPEPGIESEEEKPSHIPFRGEGKETYIDSVMSGVDFSIFSRD